MSENLEPVALTIEQAHQWLSDHGFTYTERQVKRMAWTKKLPFRAQPTGRKLFIWDVDLASALNMPGAA